MRKNFSNQGFTLIELIIVIAIIGILTTTVIATPGILDNRNKALDTANLDTATKLQQQVYSYYIATGKTVYDTTDARNLELAQLKQLNIVSQDYNFPSDEVYVLRYSSEGTPYIGFGLKSTQFIANSSCFNRTGDSVTCDATNGLFWVPLSGQLGVKRAN